MRRRLRNVHGESGCDAGPRYRDLVDPDVQRVGPGAWSTAFTFTVPTSSTSPGAATLVAPTGTSSNPTPSFSWTAVSSATYYQLWVNDASGGAKINVTYTAAAVGCGGGSGTCTISPGVSLAPGSATWWIRTANAAGPGPWSTPITFTVPTASTPPGAATLLEPSGVVATTTPSYSWAAVSGATQYQLWVMTRAPRRKST